jgi:hypothetical protein
MEMSTKEHLIKTVLMELEFIFLPMGINMKGNFCKGSSMGEESIFMIAQQTIITKGNGRMVAKKEEGN